MESYKETVAMKRMAKAILAGTFAASVVASGCVTVESTWKADGVKMIPYVILGMPVAGVLLTALFFWTCSALKRRQ
jgi:hypothetical protein